MKLNIIYRTCDQVESVHSVPRPFGLKKKELIRLCFSSLLEALQELEVVLHIVGDNLSAESKAFFTKACQHLPTKQHYFERLGNQNSLLKCHSIVSELPDDELVYLCEDDYLHLPNSLKACLDLFENKNEILNKQEQFLLKGSAQLVKRDLFIYPADEPDRYKINEKNLTHLFLGKYNHWRQVSNTTFTFMTTVKTFKKHQRLFVKSTVGANDGFWSKSLFTKWIYGDWFFKNKALCLSPVPSLTAHFHESSLPPFIDWKERIALLKLKI